MRYLSRKLIASIQLRYYIKPNPKGRNDRSLEKDAKKVPLKRRFYSN